jgi:hypothetical protein
MSSTWPPFVVHSVRYQLPSSARPPLMLLCCSRSWPPLMSSARSTISCYQPSSGVACPQRCCNALDSDGMKMRAVGWRCSYGTPLENIFLGLLYSRAGTAIWPLRYPIWVTSVGGSLTPFSRQQLPLFLLTYRCAAAPHCTIPRSRTLWSISLSGGPI